MGAATAEWLRRCRNGDRRLAGAVDSARSRLPPRLAARWGDDLLSRPVFVGTRQMAGFAADLDALFGLLASLPSRLFGGDLAAYCRHVGIDERRAALLTRPSGQPPCYGRADAYHDGESFKLLEFNIGSEIGGIDTAHIARALVQAPAFREFAEEFGLGFVDTGEELAKTLCRAAAPLTGGGRPVVALVEPDGHLEDYLPASLSFVEMLEGFGIHTLLGEIGDVSERAGRLSMHGTEIQVVLRYFTEAELVDNPASMRGAAMMLAAHEEGRAVLWTTLRSKLFASKGCLALLSDPRFRKGLTSDEVELADRVLPWTRTLPPAREGLDPAAEELVDHCLLSRETLLVKPRLGHDGAGIVAGWQVTDREWAQALRSAARTGAVVQRRVLPRSEEMIDPGSGAVTSLHTTWSSFVMPDGYAGSTVRTLPLDNVSGVHKVGAVFHEGETA